MAANAHRHMLGLSRMPSSITSDRHGREVGEQRSKGSGAVQQATQQLLHSGSAGGHAPSKKPS